MNAARRDAAVAILLESGFEAITAEAIAARTGEPVTAVVADWDGPYDLVLQVVSDLRADPPTIPPSGSLETRLWGLIAAAAVRLDQPMAVNVAGALIAAARSDARLADGLRDLIVEPRRIAVRRVLEDGIASGELRADLDLDLTTDTLVGPVYYRVIVTGTSVGRDDVRQIVQLVLTGARSTRRTR